VKIPSNEAGSGKAEVECKVASFSDAASIVDLILSRSSSIDVAETASLRCRADRLVLKLYASPLMLTSVFSSMNFSVDCKSVANDLSDAAENTDGIQHVPDAAMSISMTGSLAVGGLYVSRMQ
jgi:hypothetical protein